MIRRETEKDRFNEALIMGEFMCDVMNDGRPDDNLFEAVKCPDDGGNKCCPDFRINIGGKTVGYSEVKRRPGWTNQKMMNVGGNIIDSQKYLMLEDLCKRYRVCLVIGLDDCHGYHVVNTDEVSDPFDLEITQADGSKEIHSVVKFNHEDFRIHHDIGLPK